MKVEPYISRDERKQKLWSEVASILKVTPEEAFHIYLHTYFTGMEASTFLKLLKDGRITPEKLADSSIPPFVPKSEKDEQECKDVSDLLGESDRKNHVLKALIEIGDEILCNESKLFTFSKIEYLSKFKWYKVLQLKDEGQADFTAITETNLPGEEGYASPWSIDVVRRDGKVIFDRWTGTHLAHLPENRRIVTSNGYLVRPGDTVVRNIPGESAIKVVINEITGTGKVHCYYAGDIVVLLDPMHVFADPALLRSPCKA